MRIKSGTMSLQKINHATDMTSMGCLHNAVKSLSMRDRRMVCSILRQGAGPSVLIPALGITLGQYCVFVSLQDSIKP